MNTVSQRFIKTEFLKHLLHAETIKFWYESQQKLQQDFERKKAYDLIRLENIAKIKQIIEDTNYFTILRQMLHVDRKGV